MPRLYWKHYKGDRPSPGPTALTLVDSLHKRHHINKYGQNGGIRWIDFDGDPRDIDREIAADFPEMKPVRPADLPKNWTA